MPRIHFGHCIGCGQPIRPPYLSFIVSLDTGNGIWNWEEADVCGECAPKLPASELHRLVSAEEEDAA
jgi:hypothetical protein